MIVEKVFEIVDFQEYRISFISDGWIVYSRCVPQNENFAFLKDAELESISNKNLMYS